MPANGHDDSKADASKGTVDDAREHLFCVREAISGYAEAVGMTVADILLPTMPESTRRGASGQVFIGLLAALDPADEHDGENGELKDVSRSDRFADVPLLVCTLEHPTTGIRVAVMGTAAAGG
jgi:hypothetical protein